MASNIVETAKQLFSAHIKPDSILVDFTMGNGNDTVFMSKLAPEGKVYAFDIQPEALTNTRQKLLDNRCPENTELILSSHSNVDQYVKEPISAGMFNLGYKPGGDKSITTKLGTTMEAIKKALSLLVPGGILIVVIYPGHPEGEKEGQSIEAFGKSLDRFAYNVLLYRLLNHSQSPYILAFEKTGRIKSAS